MTLRTEQLWPYAASVVVGVLAWWRGFHFPQKGDEILLEPIISNSITVASIFIGILTGALALLPALESKIMRAARDAGYDRVLNRYLVEGIVSSTLFVFLSFSAFWLGERPHFAAIWAAIGAAASTTFFRVTKLVFTISGMK